MAHPFDGDWDSIVFDSNSKPQPDNKFTLKVNAAGDKLDPANSKHGANRVNGNITSVMAQANKHRIHIVDDRANPPADYFGVLLFDIPTVDGKTVHIIVGTRELPTTPIDPLRKDRRTRANGQEEGTWVATKKD